MPSLQSSGWKKNRTPIWRTEYGDRILQNTEARLFDQSLLSLLDKLFLNEFDEYSLGIETIDNLTYNQKISTLSTIANGLLREEVPVVPQTETSKCTENSFSCQGRTFQRQGLTPCLLKAYNCGRNVRTRNCIQLP